MNKLLTEQETLTANLQIWAIPHSKWHIENFPDDGYFRYAVTTEAPYGDNNILCNEVETTIVLPAGIDLGAKAIETLKADIAKTRREAKERCELLQEQINCMQQLTHMVEEYDPIHSDDVISAGASNAYVNQD